MRKEAAEDAEPVKPTEQVERIDTTATLVMQIQKCSRLYTTEYQVHKIVTHDDDIKLKGKLFSKKYNITLPLGQRKVAIPMEATLKAYVDFAEFSADNVRRDSTHIELILPDPRIVLTSSRIDHNEIKEYVALMRSNFSEEEPQSYEMQGREVIIHDIANSDITERARRECRQRHRAHTQTAGLQAAEHHHLVPQEIHAYGCRGHHQLKFCREQGQRYTPIG